MTHADTTASGNHCHDADFTIPDDPGELYGEPGAVRMKSVGMLIGATYDDCEPCIEQALDEVVDVPARVRRVMELAYVFAERMSDRAIGDMVGDTDYTPEFRAVMRAGVEQQNQALPTIVALPPAGRRNAARDAAKVVVSLLPRQGKWHRAR